MHEPCYHCYLHFAGLRSRNGERCGKLMPVARSLCARRAGHRNECRTRMCMLDDTLSRKAKRMGLGYRREFERRRFGTA